MTDRPWPSAAWLLVYVGMLTGVNAPLGKLAADGGVPPALWALVVSGGAALGLVPWLAWHGRLRLPRGTEWRYGLVAGLITFVGANFVLFLALPRVGAGQMGLMFALSPMLTLALSRLFGLRRPGALGLAGIVLGMTGAMVVALTRGAGVSGVGLWSAFGLLMPLLLAAGNVYRTLDWPEGADPAGLALWSHAVAALVFAAGLLATGGFDLGALQDVPGVTAAQVAVSVVTFPAFFLLQRRGGPVVLSQIGYVAAATGLVLATVALGERFGWATWAGALVIAGGIACSILDQRRAPFAAAPPRARQSS